MKKFLLNPIFGPLMSILAVLVFAFLAWHQFYTKDALFFEPLNTCDFITYAVYIVAFCIGLLFWRDSKGNQKDYILFLFLLVCAVLREAGIQHWLTSTDSTAFKLRFFTNPNNPLSDKIRALVLLVIVGVAALYLIWKYVPKIWKGFWAQNPMYWSVATLGCMGIVCKIADRFPGNYAKMTGVRLPQEIAYWFSIVEEGCELTLPLMFAIAFIQYHYLKKKN